MKIAFYAPLKNPEHPIPSGDRSIARLLMHALIEEGHEVFLVSKFRSFTKDPSNQELIKKNSYKEVKNTLSFFDNNIPDIWFTYHLYYKAPDYLGPKITRILSIPYIIAEASYSPKRNKDDWKFGNQEALKAIKLADAILHLNNNDIDCINPEINDTAKTFSIPPFINHKIFSAGLEEKKKFKQNLIKKLNLPQDTVFLLTVAMMREDSSKFPSYEFLSEVLNIVEQNFYLLVAGDGTSRKKITQILKQSTKERVYFFGSLKEEKLLELYKASDIYVWPGINEAFGISFLEAQSAKLPILANNYGGISSIIKKNETGFLIEPNDKEKFAQKIDLLIKDSNLRKSMGLSASLFVKNERSIESVSGKIQKAILQVKSNYTNR